MQKIFIIGGDRRQQYLNETLKAEGFSTYSFGTSNFCSKSAFLEILRMEYAPIVLLPLPATKDKETISMPLSETALPFTELLSVLQQSAYILGFQIPKPWCEAAKEKGIHVQELYNESVIEANAVLTAKATVRLLESTLKTPLFTNQIAILGFGHVGKAVYRSLKPYSQNTKVFVRRSSVYQALREQNISAFFIDALESQIPSVDILINTVPSPIVKENILKKAKENILLLELASKPFGIDFEAAKAQNETVLKAGGLPGKYFPLEASEILLEEVRKVL